MAGSGTRRPRTVRLCGRLRGRQSRTRLGPLRGDLAQDVEPRPDVGGALGVVGRDREQAARPRAARRALAAWKLGGGLGERRVGAATDLVAREERRVGVEGGVLDSFGRRRPAELLKALDEPEPALGRARARTSTPSSAPSSISSAAALLLPRALASAIAPSSRRRSSGPGTGERPST